MRKERLEPPVDLLAIQPFDLDAHQRIQHGIADDDIEEQARGGVRAVNLGLARCGPFGEQLDQFLQRRHMKIEVNLHREFMIAQTFGYQHPHQGNGVRRFHQFALAMRITLQDFDARQSPGRVLIKRPQHGFVAPASRDRAKQPLLVAEQFIEGRQRTARALDDFGKAGAFIALFKEQRFGRVENGFLPPFAWS